MPDRFDGDAVLIAQTEGPGPAEDVAVATTNVKHIGQYVTAEVWEQLEV